MRYVALESSLMKRLKAVHTLLGFQLLCTLDNSLAGDAQQLADVIRDGQELSCQGCCDEDPDRCKFRSPSLGSMLT